jgi:hypothetical protein
MSLATAFFEIFRGNEAAHYTFKPGVYAAIDRGITIEDIERHLRGELPGLLSIPILAGDLCHFAAGDCDRHFEADEPIDFVAVAKKISELGLPLIITRSKSPKSAHVWLFFKEKDGFSCSDAQRLIEKYMRLLGTTGEIEIFPKQEELKDGQKGSGINLPYFSDTRIAFGRDGEELDLAGFIDLVRDRQSYGQVLVTRDLAGEPSRHGASKEKSQGPLPVAAIRAVHQKQLVTLRESNQVGHWNIALNTCAYYAGRAFAAGALEGTKEVIQNDIRTAAQARTGFDERVMENTIERSWEDGVREPLEILDAQKAHDEALARIDAWLASDDIEMKHEDAYNDLALLTDEEYQQRRWSAKKRLKITASALDGFVHKRHGASTDESDIDPADLTVETVKQLVEDLLDDDPKEYQKKAAENIIWDYLRTHAKVFCCYNQGFFLLNNGDGVAIDVGKDSQEFDRLLISFGVHPGSPSHNRIGAFLETKCYHEGVKTETRLGFHFDRRRFAAYVAAWRGKLIKVTRMGLEEVPNGHDNQLFVFPDGWVPLLSKPLHEINGVTGMDTVLDATNGVIANMKVPIQRRSLCVHALFVDGFLARHLFEGSSFEIRTMDEKQIRILIMAFILFLMMPGVVSERALLESLGPSESGKTFLLKLIGRTLVGPDFSPRALPKDIRELENAIINSFFIAFDNVSTVPQDIKDRLAQAVTGIEVVRRVLFTDKRELREKSKATISLSAIRPPLPELEHGNRSITINFEARPEGTFIAEEELFRVLEEKRDNIILNLLHRMILVLEALHAQKDYVPKVNIRLASIATFILRIARHEKWEDRAKKLLADWSSEQTSSSMLDDQVSIAMTRWIAGSDWVPNVELSASTLNEQLCAAMGFGDPKLLANRKDLSWHGQYLLLNNVIIANLKVYEKSFGMKRGKSTLRNSRGGHSYRFNPTAELLAEIRSQAKFERDSLPQVELPYPGA